MRRCWSGAGDEEVRHAYRILALATHPDRHPEDSASSERFCIIQSAYETILASAHTSGVQGSITFRIDTLTLVSTLVAVGDTILVGSSDGVLSMLDSKGRGTRTSNSRRSGMKLAVDSKGVLVAAFCDGALSFFDGTSIVNAAEVEAVPHFADALARRHPLRTWSNSPGVQSDWEKRVVHRLREAHLGAIGQRPLSDLWCRCASGGFRTPIPIVSVHRFREFPYTRGAVSAGVR